MLDKIRIIIEQASANVLNQGNSEFDTTNYNDCVCGNENSDALVRIAIK